METPQCNHVTKEPARLPLRVGLTSKSWTTIGESGYTEQEVHHKAYRVVNQVCGT